MPASKSPKTTKRSMSDQHKASLAQGRQEGRVVRNYLEALERHAPKRGRRRTVDSVDRRLAAIEKELMAADPVTRLKLVQERRDLTAERSTLGAPADLAGLENDFVEIAASYSHRQGISYQSWREVGVPAAVLSRAGISRSQ
jgi:hypothetical protein